MPLSNTSKHLQMQNSSTQSKPKFHNPHLKYIKDAFQQKDQLTSVGESVNPQSGYATEMPVPILGEMSHHAQAY
jgi:hypothetical protein